MCLNLSPMSPKPEDEDDLVECVHRYTAILMKMKLRKLRGCKRKKDDYSLIDITFLVIFPIIFFVFNIIYW